MSDNGSCLKYGGMTEQICVFTCWQSKFYFELLMERKQNLLLNHLLIAKYYICSCYLNEQELDFKTYLNIVEKKYIIERQIGLQNREIDFVRRKWSIKQICVRIVVMRSNYQHIILFNSNLQ